MVVKNCGTIESDQNVVSMGARCSLYFATLLQFTYPCIVLYFSTCTVAVPPPRPSPPDFHSIEGGNSPLLVFFFATHCKHNAQPLPDLGVADNRLSNAPCHLPVSSGYVCPQVPFLMPLEGF